MARIEGLNAGDYVELRRGYGTQIAVFSKYGRGDAVHVRRWNESKGEFGSSVVRVHVMDLVGLAKSTDPRVARAKAAHEKAQEGIWK